MYTQTLLQNSYMFAKDNTLQLRVDGKEGSHHGGYRNQSGGQSFEEVQWTFSPYDIQHDSGAALIHITCDPSGM